MATSSRDRISVDLRGLGSRLQARAEALDISPSALVRKAVVEELVRLDGRPPGADQPDIAAADDRRARLCLRMSAAHAALVVASASRAGLSPGTYVGRLAAGVPAIAQARYGDYVLALRTSTSELATLSRNIHRLIELLRQGDLPQARPYRDMLDLVADDVRAHLRAAACVLAALAPTRRGQVGEPLAAI